MNAPEPEQTRPTDDETPLPEDETLAREAAVYAVLSRCWREPTETLIEAIDEGALESVLPGVDGIDLDELRVEYTRLLVGPGEEQVPPYESVFRDVESGQERGQVLGASTRDVLEWYESHGLTPEDGDMPDHIATELEFLAYLAESGEREATDEFLAAHPHEWVGQFLDAVSTETTHPYYESLVEVTRAVLAPPREN